MMTIMMMMWDDDDEDSDDNDNQSDNENHYGDDCGTEMFCSATAIHTNMQRCTKYKATREGQHRSIDLRPHQD